MKRYLFEHCNNLRDIGGYPIPESKYVRYGKFFRSDAPVCLSKEEINLLYQKNIKTIIDLRYKDEVLRRPCALEGLDGFEYYNYSIGNGILPTSEEAIGQSYLSFTQNKEAMRKVFQTMADAQNGVLYHCSAGKDRTGVITAILLSLAGVMECDILADYEVSYTYIRDIIFALRNDNPDLPAFAGRSKIEYLESFLNMFYEMYQNSETYLLEIGLKKSTIDCLRMKLIETENYIDRS